MRKNPYKKKVRDLEAHLKNMRSEIDDLLDDEREDDDDSSNDEEQVVKWSWNGGEAVPLLDRNNERN